MNDTTLARPLITACAYEHWSCDTHYILKLHVAVMYVHTYIRRRVRTSNDVRSAEDGPDGQVHDSDEHNENETLDEARVGDFYSLSWFYLKYHRYPAYTHTHIHTDYYVCTSHNRVRVFSLYVHCVDAWMCESARGMMADKFTQYIRISNFIQIFAIILLFCRFFSFHYYNNGCFPFLCIFRFIILLI